MLKAVFRPMELIPVSDKIVLDSPTSFQELSHLAPVEEVVEEKKEDEVYTGPTADDLRREAEAFKAEWENEKERMYQAARTEAQHIIEDAQNTASSGISRSNDEANMIIQRAQSEAEQIIQDAQKKASDLENEVRQTLDEEQKNAREKGHEEGRKEGYSEGKAEVERLAERVQAILERAQERRGEILAECEQQIVDLVLLITRKVIKVLSENQKNVVVSNVVQALRKVKSRGNITIRVNMSDLQLATEHKKEFIALLEGANSINLAEDTTVDAGGCIIETDFGEIDARISSQLSELENKILEITPIKSETKGSRTADRAAGLEKELRASAALLNTANSS